MAGILNLLMGVGGGELIGTPGLGNETAANIGETGTITASYSLNSNGSKSGSGIGGFWINPVNGMSLFEVFARLDAGALNGGATGSWLPLNINRTWRVQRSTPGTNSAQIFLQIRRIGGPGTILASAAIDIVANYF